MENTYSTGWFGRANENGLSRVSTRVHAIKNGKCMCGYKPHKTLQYQFCSNGLVYGYIECPKCKEIASQILLNDYRKSDFKTYKMKKLILPILILFSFYCKGQTFNQMYEDSVIGIFRIGDIRIDTTSMYYISDKPFTTKVKLLVTDSKNKNAHYVEGYERHNPINIFGEEVQYFDKNKKPFNPSVTIWMVKEK